MSFIDRMDAEHKAAVESVPDGLHDLRDIPAARAMALELFEGMADQVPEIPGVTVTDHMTPGPASAPELLVRIYRPEGLETRAPALFWMHAGGTVMGNVPMDDPRCKSIALEVGCVVASVEYRLAPEDPHPAQIEDCRAGLAWFVANAESLGVDRKRLAIGGASAGGGLAASLALLMRDRAEFDVAFQWLISPMIDDRNITHSSHYVTHPKVWHRDANIAAWRARLGDATGGVEVSPYAAAARAEDLSGLPPAYIAVPELDLFVDESIDYATRLLRAGVPTELQVYPGAYHYSDFLVPTSALSQRIIADRNAALRRALR